MTIERAIEILDPEHREQYESIEPVNEACLMAIDALKKTAGGITVENKNFATIAICAIRYCMGRKTYMPDLVRSIVTPLLSELSDNDIIVMLNDCEFQAFSQDYGDEQIDKPGWLKWQSTLQDEAKRRGMKYER